MVTRDERLNSLGFMFHSGWLLFKLLVALPFTVCAIVFLFQFYELVCIVRLTKNVSSFLHLVLLPSIVFSYVSIFTNNHSVFHDSILSGKLFHKWFIRVLWILVRLFSPCCDQAQVVKISVEKVLEKTVVFKMNPHLL